jgi:hypothetical protein
MTEVVTSQWPNGTSQWPNGGWTVDLAAILRAHGYDPLRVIRFDLGESPEGRPTVNNVRIRL